MFWRTVQARIFQLGIHWVNDFLYRALRTGLTGPIHPLIYQFSFHDKFVSQLSQKPCKKDRQTWYPKVLKYWDT